jgi:hypothetical protein
MADTWICESPVGDSAMCSSVLCLPSRESETLEKDVLSIWMLGLAMGVTVTVLTCVFLLCAETPLLINTK